MTYTVKPMTIGVNGFPVQVLLIDTDNTAAEVLTTGYLGPAFNYTDVTFSNKQLAIVSTTDGGTATYTVSVDSNGVASLLPGDDNPTAVNIHGAPVTDKHFAAFYGTDGTIQDLEWSASEPSHTTVVMKDSSSVASGYIAKFSDTFGSIGAANGPAVNVGNFIAGVNGTPGKFISVAPTASSGSMTFEAQDNAGAYGVVVNNRSHAQDSTRYIPDIGASGDFLLTALANPDANINLVRFDASVTTAALASAGVVNLFTSSGSKQYKIVALWLNFGSNLTTGDRNLAISDGTTTYSVIPSASLLTLVNATWGSTALPLPASAALNTSTAAGQNLRCAYSGGTTDYDSGSTIVISGILQRVA